MTKKTKFWFVKFYYKDYTGAKKQKKKRGFKLQQEAKEWEQHRRKEERIQEQNPSVFQRQARKSDYTCRYTGVAEPANRSRIFRYIPRPKAGHMGKRR